MRSFVKWISGAVAASALVLAGCGGGSNWDGGRLDVAGSVDKPAAYSYFDLLRLPATTQSVQFTSGSGSQSRVFTGTNLWALLSTSGIKVDTTQRGDINNRYVLATAEDGYRSVFSLGELNPDFGNQPNLVAYAETTNGVSTVLASDGPFRTTAPGDTKGGRYVSNLTRLDVRASGSTATGIGGGLSSGFAVSGAVTKPMRFDLAALQALPATTQTVGGSAYTGVSLWHLLNTTTGLKLDSTVKNPSLSMYAVATGSDGYKALVSLGEIDPGFGNRTALIAYSVNGSLLDRNGVARLVVPGDAKLGRSVSNLVSLEVFAAAAAP